MTIQLINRAKRIIHLFTLKELIALSIGVIASIFAIIFIILISLSGSLWRMRQHNQIVDDKILNSLAKLERDDSMLRKNDSLQFERISHIPTNPLDLQSMTKVSSVYNYRKNPNTGAQEFHAGIDYNVKRGTAVYAAATGTVIEAKYDGDYGKTIKIKHGNGYETQYSHLDTIAVKEGEEIEQGKQIGKVGMTGNATGSHLDYRIIFNDKFINPVNFTYCK